MTATIINRSANQTDETLTFNCPSLDIKVGNLKKNLKIWVKIHKTAQSCKHRMKS